MVAAVIGGHLRAAPIPAACSPRSAVALAFAVLYVALLFLLRVIPETHWEALAHMTRSLVSGRPDRFRPRRGLRALRAVRARRPACRRRVELGSTRGSAGEPRRPTGTMRPRSSSSSAPCAGQASGAGSRSATASALDAEIGAYLFSSAPTARPQRRHAPPARRRGRRRRPPRARGPRLAPRDRPRRRLGRQAPAGTGGVSTRPPDDPSAVRQAPRPRSCSSAAPAAAARTCSPR